MKEFMEKKNMVLLTVIAIATLLVAVVGATFAYFTATITPSGTSTQTTVNTKTLANVTFDQGNGLTASGWCPGNYGATTFNIAAGAGDVAAKVKLSFKQSTSTFTTGNLKYELYEATDANKADLPTVTPGTCGYTADGTGQRYFANGALGTVGTGAKKVASGVLTQGAITALNYTATIPVSTKMQYVLVVYLENVTTGEQNADQGKTATVEIKAELVNA